MPALELQHVDGSAESRPLSRTQPLTIGRQPFNDICVPEDGVGAMHCRVLWNKTTFEVTAATSDGVEVNGTSVSHVRLSSGDIIRVGSLDLVYRDESAEDSGQETVGHRLADPGSFDDPRGKRLPLLPDAILGRREPTRENARDDARPASPAERAAHDKEAVPPTPRASVHDPVDDLSSYEGPVYTESQAIAAYEAGDLPMPEPEAPVAKLPRVPTSYSPESGHAGNSGKPTAASRGAGLSLTSRTRPGEQDIFRSPLVLGLSLGGLVLVLVTGIFWFLIGREQASRLYDRALSELDSGQYAQSIASFESFLQQYSGHSLRKQAERGLDRALVQREISGATPAWKRGLEQLQELITRHRNEPDFADMQPVVQRFAEEIALGAARSAEAARDPELLTVSEDAQLLLERYADPAAPPAAALARIKEARVIAVIAIGKQKLFDDGMAAVDAAITDRKPMLALAEREKLVRAFDGFATLKRVKESLQKALDLEKSVIVTDDSERAAETMEQVPPGGAASLGLFHTRTRTDESSLGAVVYVLAKDNCYAVDSVTGELVWRRIIGFDAPFFPVTAAGSQPCVLMYDANLLSLVCCQPANGQLIWRQKLDGRPRSAPLIHEGQIYLPTDDRSLCRIDVENGRLTERITFSQNIHGPPVLTKDGNHLLVAGEMSMIYSLSMRPLAAASTTFTDHAGGSISAPPLALGKLFLLCVNDKADSAVLRLWNAENPSVPLVEMTTKSIRVRGQVREAPVLRGNQLVVPSSGEQLAAFSVTDDPAREGLAPIGQYRVREDDEIEKRSAADPQQKPKPDSADAAPPVTRTGPRVPLYLALGSDRQFWTASSAFRRLEIGADAIHMDSKTVAPGIASQQLQSIGDQFYVARKGLFHDAVVFSAVDRDRMTIPWRIALGTELLEVSLSRNGGAVGVSEAGHVVLLEPDRLRQGGFDMKAAIELDLPTGIHRRLVATTLHDGRLFAAANGDQTQIWIVGSGGQLDLNLKLPKGDTVQAGAVLLDEGLVVPLPGRLKLASTSIGKKLVQDFLSPAVENATHTWKFLVRLDGDEVLACQSNGLLQRIQMRTAEIPHLAEAAKMQLANPIDLPPALRGETVLIADASGTVQQLNWRTFDQEGKRTFESTVRGVWPLSSGWLVWSGDGKLHGLSDGRELQTQWSFDLKELQPVGAPLETGDQLWFACRDGTVIALNAQSGHESARHRIPQLLTMGVKKLNERLFAVACDGTLYRLEPAGQ